MGLTERVKEEVQRELNREATIEKKFRFPFGKKVGISQKKKNFTTVLTLNENGTYDFKKYQIKDQAFWHDSIPRLATSGHVMFDKKGNPLIILPNWSVEPFSPLANYKESMTEGNNTTGYKVLMALMESSKVDSKPKMGGMIKWIGIIAVIGIIVYAFISSGGG